MKKSIVMERQLEGEIVDTAKINQVIKGSAGAMIGLMESELFKDKSGYTYHHEYKDEILTQYKSRNDNQEDLLTINTKTRMFSNDFTEAYYDFANNNIIDIKELRNEIKLIKNFKCFKVVYTYSEGDSEEEQLPYFAELMNGYKYTREMWVTDKIKSEFHPLVKDREILTKYYPVEITEYSDMTKGMVDKYELITLQLK
jgi:hypothetical protein